MFASDHGDNKRKTDIMTNHTPDSNYRGYDGAHQPARAGDGAGPKSGFRDFHLVCSPSSMLHGMRTGFGLGMFVHILCLCTPPPAPRIVRCLPHIEPSSSSSSTSSSSRFVLYINYLLQILLLYTAIHDHCGIWMDTEEDT